LGVYGAYLPLDFGGDVGGSECDNHAGLDDTSLNSADGYCSNTADFVDILKRESKRLIRRSDRRFNRINGLKEGESLGSSGLAFLRPTLEPGHVGGLFNHVITVPARDGDEGDSLGVVSLTHALER